MRAGFSGKEVHALRLEFKRLRALLEVLDFCMPGSDMRALFQVFKKKYRILGHFREASQLKRMLENAKRLASERRKLAEQEIARLQESAEKKLSADFFQTIKNQAKALEKKLLADACFFRPERFQEWMFERAALLRQIDPKKLDRSAESHAYRKQLKSFLYNLELSDKGERLVLIKNCPPPPDSETLQNLLGARQDRADWKRFLASF